MTDLHDVITAARPTMTPLEAWRHKQRRAFVIASIVGVALFFVGVGLLNRPEHDAALGIWVIALGLVGILVGGWFGLRALVGEPSEGQGA